jgi:hypothetical protein
MIQHIPANVRKRRLDEPGPRISREPSHHTEVPILERAVVHFSSEDPAHPIECMFDGTAGIGASYWAGARPDSTEVLVLEFDEPQHIGHVAFEVEESRVERIQEVRAEFSVDGGKTFRHAFIQEYTFSPRGATYQCESLEVDLHDVTHFRLTVVPNKSGSGTACLTSLRLFS